ncbi:hypothetical protein ASC72_19040 [Flavobacterium sp. Root420]|nr:hypothetical protein ASC72_19040 [Flavobacterium sp. Root420]
MRQFLCLEPTKVQTFFDLYKSLKKDFITYSKSNPYIFSYSTYMLKTTIGFLAYNICISQISFVYA